MNESLGEFVNRYAFKYERFYPHPVERVWRALIDEHELDGWMFLNNKIDAREGGRVAFTFGIDEATAVHGTIVEFRENEVVDYKFDHGGSMRFEIEPVPGGTRLTFIQAFMPGAGTEIEDYPGGDLPGGPDTPWRPGFMAGFYYCLRDLGNVLDGTGPTREEVRAELDHYINRDLDPSTGRPSDDYYGDRRAQWGELVPVYRQLIIDTLPAR